MNAQADSTQSFSDVIDSLTEHLRRSSYSEVTISVMKRTFKRIEKFIRDNSFSQYSTTIGEQFLKEVNRESHTHSHSVYLKRCIRYLNEFIGSGAIEAFTPRTSKQQILPAFEIPLQRYLEDCRNRGNKENTIAFKEFYLRQFLYQCQVDNFSTLEDLTAEEAVNAALSLSNRGAWAVVRAFLLHLCMGGVLLRDLSTVIPHYTVPSNIPSTFSIDELHRVEAAIDRNTAIGSRDYAFILMFTRLGMRVGDIAQLEFDSIDFNSKTIHLIQQKTGEPLALPILPDVESALKNYIRLFRPKNTLPYVFLRVKAPYIRISTGTVNHRLKVYFDKAGVDISNRRHGPHAIRASLVTSMINEKIPYDAVRKVLGHKDPNAIKHYAKIDIENLRQCALAVPPPSGNFKAFLESGGVYEN